MGRFSPGTRVRVVGFQELHGKTGVVRPWGKEGSEPNSPVECLCPLDWVLVDFGERVGLVYDPDYSETVCAIEACFLKEDRLIEFEIIDG